MTAIRYKLARIEHWEIKAACNPNGLFVETLVFDKNDVLRIQMGFAPDHPDNVVISRTCSGCLIECSPKHRLPYLTNFFKRRQRATLI